MPSENKTLELIQREIMDVMEREKELRNFYNNNNNNNNVEEPKMNGIKTNTTNGNDLPPLARAQSTSVLTDGEAIHTTNQTPRRFATNPNNKGLMQKFFKARGKLSNIQTLSIRTQNQTIPDLSAPKVAVEPGKKVRNGFVPIEERIKKEFQEARTREVELRDIRRKSQPDLQAALDLEMELDPPLTNGLRSTKSMLQLYNPDEDEGIATSSSAPTSLKPAVSLADLCEAENGEIQSPQSLIMQFEQIIKKNQQART